MKKALIIAYDVAPLELISSQRLNHLILFLTQNNIAVDVLTSAKQPIDGPINDVITYEKLKEIANFIEMPSLAKSKNNPAPLTSSIQPKASLMRDLLKKVKQQLGSTTGLLLDYRSLWAWNCIQYFKKNTLPNYDIVISSSLPVSVNGLGYFIKKKLPNTIWIADFRDLWTLNKHGLDYNFVGKSIDRFLEKKWLSKADLITTVSEDLVSQMQKLHKKDTLLIRNGCIPEEYIHLQANHSLFHKNKINIVYAGNIYKNRRDPSLLIQTIQNNNLTEHVHIHFFGIYLENLNSIIQANSADNFCFIHKALPRKEILEISKAADFNLFLESSEEDAKGILSGKIFELIAINNPIISIGPKEDFESTKLLKETGLWTDLKLFSHDFQDIKSHKIRINQLDNTELISRDHQVKKLLQYIGCI